MDLYNRIKRGAYGVILAGSLLSAPTIAMLNPTAVYAAEEKKGFFDKLWGNAEKAQGKVEKEAKETKKKVEGFIKKHNIKEKAMDLGLNVLDKFSAATAIDISKLEQAVEQAPNAKVKPYLGVSELLVPSDKSEAPTYTYKIRINFKGQITEINKEKRVLFRDKYEHGIRIEVYEGKYSENSKPKVIFMDNGSNGTIDEVLVNDEWHFASFENLADSWDVYHSIVKNINSQLTKKSDKKGAKSGKETEADDSSAESDSGNVHYDPKPLNRGIDFSNPQNMDQGIESIDHAIEQLERMEKSIPENMRGPIERNVEKLKNLKEFVEENKDDPKKVLEYIREHPPF